MENRIILATGSYDTIRSGNTVSITGDGVIPGDIMDQHIKNLRLD